MWNNLPFDLLAKIFSFLSPHSLAIARSACRHWHTCSDSYYLGAVSKQHRPDWFVALPMRNHRFCCYAHNPFVDDWYMLSIDSVFDSVRLVAPVDCLLLLKPKNSVLSQLFLCNPFTRQFRQLPMLNITRTNPAVGVVIVLDPIQHVPFPYFRIYVAGGMSKASGGGATYEPTVEMFDSKCDKWKLVGSMPVEFAVRLTVWTPNESVYSNGILYWMTSARAYSVMGFEIGSNTWRELSVPMADQLEFAAIVRRNRRLTLVGGGGDSCEGNAYVWELVDGDFWGLIEKVPDELKMKLLGEMGSWGSTKCIGTDGEICLYRDIGSGMVVWRETGEMGKWEWSWIDGCSSIKGKKVHNFPIKGVLLQPNISPFCILNK